MTTPRYDVLVLGAGPGGYVAAVRAAQLGLRTAIVEPRMWGGVCLNIGCIPSKALLRNAEVVNLLTRERATFGIRVEGEPRFDYAEAFRRSRRVADARARGVRFLMRKNQIDEHEGWGQFVDPHTVEVRRASGEVTRLEFGAAIIAVGARPRRLPQAPRSERIGTYEEQILADRVPGSIAIVGGGAIGLEFAHLLATYGARVTIVELTDRVAPVEDEEISALVRKQMERRSIEVLVSTRVVALEDDGAQVHVGLEHADGGRRTLVVERVLQAIGFAPRTDDYGLERAGVGLGPRGGIAVDAAQRTNVPHIYAVGDVTGQVMLAHAAEAMGIIAAEAIAGRPTTPLDPVMVPRTTFCTPQIASFGHTEAQARALGHDVVVSKFPFQANGKAQGLGDYTGFVKLIGARQDGRILGAHLVGPEVTELLPELTLAQKAELSAEEIASNIHAHPTLGEAVMEAAHGILGSPINL
jgi:dihydrolipoamide dehydrogenase